MAKMFYTAEEASEKLGKSEDELRDLVRQGKLREFRDAGKANYRVEEIDKLAGQLAAESPPSPSSGKSSAPSRAPGASSSGEIVLEPVEDSGVSLSSTGSDVLSLEEVESDDTSMGPATEEKKKKEDTVVPSVGMNVFDDDDLDEVVDPLAQTAVTDVAGMGFEGSGSGSGILDLTRESDDTSLGAELLEEIYTGEDEAAAEETAEAAGDTRVGLDAGVAEAEELEIPAEAVEGAAPTRAKAMVAPGIDAGLDPATAGLTALMIVAVVLLWLAGIAGAALVRGVAPGLILAIHANLLMFTGGALGVAVIAAAVTYFLAKRSG